MYGYIYTYAIGSLIQGGDAQSTTAIVGIAIVGTSTVG